jgi:hypothetical protein
LLGQNILIGDSSAVTLVDTDSSTTKGIAIAPLNINDPNQRWDIISGFITSASPVSIPSPLWHQFVLLLVGIC